MKFFIDTAKVEDIREANDMGAIFELRKMERSCFG